MEKELNIAAILQDKPQNTRLWSPIFGDVYLKDVTDVNNNMIRITHHGVDNIFMNNGKVWADGDVCLFPSKQMQDWSKFAWKKGDVLADEERFVIFKGFENDDYTEFFAPFEYNNNNTFRQDLGLITNEFRKVNDDIAQEVIKKIEEHYGGKLNLETLEIEHTEPKQEFKDGDIVHIPAGDITDEAIFIAKVEAKGVLHSYVYMSKNSMIPLAKSLFSVSGCLDSLRPATDSEQQQLFSALAKKGKRWNPDTKTIEDLPKKCEFKPMDWCLMKDSTKYWELCQFAYTKKVHGITTYSAVGGLIYYKCIPYNEETKHLLGTTDEWKGGE